MIICGVERRCDPLTLRVQVRIEALPYSVNGGSEILCGVPLFRTLHHRGVEKRLDVYRKYQLNIVDHRAGAVTKLGD